MSQIIKHKRSHTHRITRRTNEELMQSMLDIDIVCTLYYFTIYVVRKWVILFPTNICILLDCMFTTIQQINQ